MKIAIASDHAGFDYKQRLLPFLRELGHEAIDFGAPNDEPTDYPRWVRPTAEAVARGAADRAIVLGGSGNGEAIVANRIPGVRCALCWSEPTAIWARRHNDANALALGQRTINYPLAEKIVRTFLTEPFEGGRHALRIRQIDAHRL